MEFWEAANNRLATGPYIRLDGWVGKRRQGQMTDPASVKLYPKIRCKLQAEIPQSIPNDGLSRQIHVPFTIYNCQHLGWIVKGPFDVSFDPLVLASPLDDD